MVATVSLASDTLVTIRTEQTTIVATPTHPFATAGSGWTLASDLRIGDQLRASDGRLHRVCATGTRHVTPPVSVYNMTVAPGHAYFVGSEALLVHNVCSNRPVFAASSSGLGTAPTGSAARPRPSSSVYFPPISDPTRRGNGNVRSTASSSSFESRRMAPAPSGSALDARPGFAPAPREKRSGSSVAAHGPGDPEPSSPQSWSSRESVDGVDREVLSLAKEGMEFGWWKNTVLHITPEKNAESIEEYGLLTDFGGVHPDGFANNPGAAMAHNKQLFIKNSKGRIFALRNPERAKEYEALLISQGRGPIARYLILNADQHGFGEHFNKVAGLAQSHLDIPPDALYRVNDETAQKIYAYAERNKWGPYGKQIAAEARAAKRARKETHQPPP